MPNFSGLAGRLNELAKEEGLYYPEDLLGVIESSLYVRRRLLVFYGPPGVGKSRLVRLIARALPAEPRLVAVQADWHDERPLLGEFQAAAGRFVPGALVACMHEAQAAPEQNFLFCLEEISLGDPHAYLASLLQALDAEPPSLRLAQTRDGTDAQLALPDNLLFFATMYIEGGNKKPLPRQLLDRAILIELDFANLDQFLSVWGKPFPAKDPLLEVFELLQSHGVKLGYRLFREISAAVSKASAVGLPPDAVLDHQMKGRLLTAIAGEAVIVEEPLRALVKLLSMEEVRFPETLEKAVRMLELLELHGYTAAYLT